jgi:poly(3-hydroxyalkanoate) synthetase
MPLLNIVGEADTLIPPESSLAISNLVSSTDKETFSVKSGHIGISVSRSAHKELWPKAVEWIAQRSSSSRGRADKTQKENGTRKRRKRVAEQPTPAEEPFGP